MVLLFPILHFWLQSQTEDSLRKELIALQEDKHNYETTAKESLRRVLQEKIEVVRKLSEVEVCNYMFAIFLKHKYHITILPCANTAIC